MSAAISQIPGAREYRFDVVDATAGAHCRADWTSRIGGRDETTGGKFVPNLNLTRKGWGDDIFLNVNHPDVVEDQIPELSGGVLSLTIGDKRHVFTPGENGLEWDIEFTRKPASNKMLFDLAFSPNILFCYQGELSLEEAKRSYRPDNVVGSYAVYVADKRHNRYQNGKFLHIYRPEAIDAEGNRTWCDLHIDPAAKTLAVTIPRGWLDAAIFPVRLDPYYGYTSEPGTEEENTGWAEVNISAAAMSEDGEAASVCVWHRSTALRDFQGAIYANSSGNPGALVAASSTHSCGHTTKTLTSMAITASLSSGVIYHIGATNQTGVSGSHHYFYYDTVSGKSAQYCYCGITFPNPWSSCGGDHGSTSNVQYGIYLEYTTANIYEVSLTISGAGAAAPSAKSIMPVALAVEGAGQSSPGMALEFSRSVIFQAAGAVSCAARTVISRILDVTAGADVAVSASAVLAPSLTIAGAGSMQPYWGLRRRFSLPPRGAVLGERALDPVTGDYSLAAGGDFAVEDGPGNEVYKRIFQVLHEPPLEPLVGRVLRERLKDLTRVRRQLAEDCEKALAPMIEAGRVKSVTVQEVQPATPRTGWLYLLVTVTEAGGRRRTFDYWIPVI